MCAAHNTAILMQRGVRDLCNKSISFHKRLAWAHSEAKQSGVWYKQLCLRVSCFALHVCGLTKALCSTQKNNNKYTRTVHIPSYMVMMCGWHSDDMISISRRMWTRSCSSLIFSFLMDLMATFKKEAQRIYENNIFNRGLTIIFFKLLRIWPSVQWITHYREETRLIISRPCWQNTASCLQLMALMRTIQKGTMLNNNYRIQV